MNVVVYSAIYGNYDTPKKHDIGVAPILFSDSAVTDDWEVRLVNRIERHSRMKAKFFKCNPHKCLPDHDVSIWIDGSATIHDKNFVQRCIDYLGGGDILAFRHPEGRDCIYQEAQYCKNMIKYKDVDIQGQVNYYRAVGHPEHYGLWACGMLVRKNNERIDKFNEMWWEHNLEFTYQDQLSFPFCIERSGVKLVTLELNQHSNDLITFMTPHSSDN